MNLWTIWRPVIRGSKQDDEKYRKPVMAGRTESAEGVMAVRRDLHNLGVAEKMAEVLEAALEGAVMKLTADDSQVFAEALIAANDPLAIPPQFDRRKK